MHHLNNSPNKNGTSYDSVPNRGERTYNNSGAPVQRRPIQNTQGRPLTDEERRRLAAARARMNNAAGSNTANRNPAGGVRPTNGANQNPRANPNYYGNGAGRRPVPEQNVRRRRKRRVKINAGAVVFAAVIVAVIGVSAYQLSRNSALSGDNDSTADYENVILNAQNAIQTGDTSGGDTISDKISESDNSVISDNSTVSGAFGAVTVQNTAIDEGKLVLVNYNYAYDRIDDVELTNAYNERTGKIKVSSTTLGMEPEAFTALENLVAGLVDDTGCDDLLLYSGHRTLADQQRIWDSNMSSYGEEYTKTYVAVPGHSEHHTGYACDLGFYTDDGLSIPLVDHEYGTWVWEHCTEYGYILRYPADKADITGIGHEQWHFRYIGLAHAYAVDALGFCYEEYIDYLRDYTADTKILHISADRALTDVSPDDISTVSGGWLTYFVPASNEDTTQIPIPAGEKFDNYEISGNNVDGFIVTITLD